MKHLLFFVLLLLMCIICVSPAYFLIWCICKIIKVDFAEYRTTVLVSLISSVLYSLATYMLRMIL